MSGRERALDTAMYQELLSIKGKMQKWVKDFEAEAHNETVLGGMHSVANSLDQLADLIVENS